MPNIFDRFDKPTATVLPDGKNPFDAFDDNPFDQFDEPASLKFAKLPGNLKLDPLQQVQMQSGMADPENAGATLSNLLRGNDDVFLQTVAPPITAAAHALLDNPVTRKIGYGLNFAGQAVKGDVEAALFQMLGYPELANQQLMATADDMNPAWKQKDESLGIDTSDPYEDARQTLPVAQRMTSGIGPGLLQSVPQMVLAALQPELGAASFGFTPQGFDPVQAAAAMVAPGGGKMIGDVAEGLAAKAGLSDEQALDVINRVGGGAGIAGLMSAPTAYQVAQMDPGKERDQAIQDATSNAILTGLLDSIAGREEPSGKIDIEDTTRSPVLESTALEGMAPNGVEKPISQKIDDLATTVKSLEAAVRGNQLIPAADSVAAPPQLNKTKGKIPTIRGRIPINSKYAGQTHPSGVKFTSQGFPDFSPYAELEFKLDGLTGHYATDEKKANKAAGLQKTPHGYVWHHVEDGETLQLIPKTIHNKTRHTGGAAVIRNGGFDK
jgi:A nuclease of the HNH/ENDO VII superfamily with conserved WHH